MLAFVRYAQEEMIPLDHLSKILRSGSHSPAFWLASLVISVVVLTNFASRDPRFGDLGSNVTSQSVASFVQPQFQEGGELPDSIGRFRFKDGRFRFVTVDSESTEFICLENLLLERIAQSSQSTSGDRTWIVSGNISQFRGQHYLLITSATSAPSKIALAR